MNKKVLEELAAYLDWLPQVGIPGCSCAARQAHETIFEHSAGFSDRAGVRPAGPDDLYYVFSVTKIVTCIAALQLIERGALALKEPVARYLPEYAGIKVRENAELRPARRPLTIENLFMMTGGLNYDLQAPAIQRLQKGGGASTREMVAAFAEAPLQFDPGEHYCYSLCHDILAAVVERVSGMTFGSYVQGHILRPLGMRDSSFSLAPEKRERLSAQYVYDNGTNTSRAISPCNEFILTQNYESGGAGLISSPADMIELIDALANGGVGKNGARILEPETLRTVQINRLNEKQLRDFRNKPKRYGYGWGLCGRVHMDPRISQSRSSAGEFGWGGAAGAYALADPAKKLAIFFAMHVRSCEYGQEKVHGRIRDLIYEALEP